MKIFNDYIAPNLEKCNTATSEYTYVNFHSNYSLTRHAYLVSHLKTDKIYFKARLD